MKRFLFVFALLMTAYMVASAQGRNKVSGSVVEFESNEAVTGATVRLLSLPDSALVVGTTTDVEGKFLLNNVRRGKYVLVVSFIGYVTKEKLVDLSNRRSGTLDAGRIVIVENSELLEGVEVTAMASKVQVSGDSLMFNASAYPVPEGSTLEALIKMLPGAKVDEDGNITINGKTVSKILVEGKEFFLNDKEIALKNIPVDIIAKIKTYERKSDMARVTGIDDGEEETVLDLAVKKGMNNGWFGNAQGSMGSEDRYDARTSINHFNDVMQISGLANARNTPNRWYRNGLTSNKEVGLNFSTTRKKLETGGSVRFRYNGSDVHNESSSENFAAQRGAFSVNENQNYSSNSGVNSNLRFEWKPDTMTNIIFRPNFNYSRNRGMGNSRSGSFDQNPNLLTSNVLDYNDEIAVISNGEGEITDDPVLNRLMEVVVNTNTSRNVSYSRSISGGAELQANRKLNNEGRNVTLRLTGNFNDGESKQLSAANITYNSLGTTLQNNRYYRTPSRSQNFSAQLSYSEPIAEKTYLQLSYRYDYGYNKNDRQARVYDSEAYRSLNNALFANRYDVDAMLRFMEEMGYQMRDSVRLSQFSEYRNYNQNISVQLRRVRESYNASVGIDLLPQRTKLNYKYMGKDYPEVKRSVFNWAPRANLRWNFSKDTNVRFRYNGRTQQPSMTDLLDITDDSNPLYIRKGNAQLKPSFSHNFNGNFNTYDSEKQRSLWAWANGSVVRNNVSSKTTYDKDTGVQTTTPMNINGNWNASAGLGTNIALGEKKYFNVGGNFGGGYRHSVGFYNNVKAAEEDRQDIKSITKNTSLDAGLSTSYRKELFYVELRGNLNYNHMKNNVNTNGNQNTYNFSYGANLQWTMPWGTQIATDIFMNSRRGYTSKEMNTNELLWNASISHSLLQGKALTLKAEIFDVLGEQTNISRTINAFMCRESRTNTIYQFAMFSVIYKFSVFAGKNTMGTKEERRERYMNW